MVCMSPVRRTRSRRNLPDKPQKVFSGSVCMSTLHLPFLLTLSIYLPSRKNESFLNRGKIWWENRLRIQACPACVQILDVIKTLASKYCFGYWAVLKFHAIFFSKMQLQVAGYIHCRVWNLSTKSRRWFEHFHFQLSRYPCSFSISCIWHGNVCRLHLYSKGSCQDQDLLFPLPNCVYFHFSFQNERSIFAFHPDH